MNRIPWILFGLSLVAMLYLCVLLLNAGSALSDARSEVSRLRERSDLALAIIRKDWIGKNAAGIAGLSQDFEKQGVIVGSEGNSVNIGDLIIDIKDGAVTGVHYFD
jgi:hypothetical protein